MRQPLRALPLLVAAFTWAQAADTPNTIIDTAAPSGSPTATPPSPWKDTDFLYQRFAPKVGDPNQNSLHYRLFVPPSYSTSGSAKHPLVFFLHGDDEKESGTIRNQRQMRDNGQYAFCSTASQAILPCFYALVQTSWYGRDGGAQTAVDLTAALAARYRVDPDRVFVTGLSGGGGATLSWAGKQPGNWAGFIPLSAPSPGDVGSYQPASLATIPSWFFAAADDGVIAPGNHVSQLADLRTRGARPIYTLYDNGGHSKATWGSAYGTTALITWMAGLRRGQPAAQPVEVAIAAPTAATTWTTSATSTGLSGTTTDRQFGGISAGVTSVAWSVGSGSSQAAGGTVAAWNSTVNLALPTGDTHVLATATGSSFNGSRGGSTTYCDVMLVKRGASTNTAPSVTAPAAQAPAAGITTTGSLAVAIADAQSAAAALTLTATSSDATLVPAGNIILGGSGASRSVTVNAATGRTGTATITLTVSDGELTSTASFAVTFTAAQVSGGGATVRVDFGSPSLTTAGAWNNITAPADGAVAKAVDSTGAATAIGIAVTKPFTWYNDQAPASSAVYPATAQGDTFYVGTGATARVALSGLDGSATYDVTLFAARSWNNPSTTVYTINGQTRTLDAFDNTARTVSFTGLSSVGGVLNLDVAAGSGSTAGYLGALVLTARAPVVPTATAGVIVDFGTSATPTTGNANNITDSAAGAVANAVAVDGSASGLRIAVTSAFTGAGTTGVAAATPFPAAASGDFLYAAGSMTGVVTISGLSAEKLYDIELLASRGGVTDDRTTAFTIGGTTKTLQAANNAGSTANFTGLVPVGGALTVRVAPGAGSAYGYLNALRITPRAAPALPTGNG